MPVSSLVCACITGVLLFLLRTMVCDLIWPTRTNYLVPSSACTVPVSFPALEWDWRPSSELSPDMVAIFGRKPCPIKGRPFTSPCRRGNSLFISHNINHNNSYNNYNNSNHTHHNNKKTEHHHEQQSHSFGRGQSR